MAATEAAEGEGEIMRYYGDKSRGKLKPENLANCAVAVWDSEMHRTRQCLKARGHGPDDLMCKRHAERRATMPPGWTEIPEDEDV